MAPGRGHSSTQPPQYQHSSGYTTMGWLFFFGLGIMTSSGQMLTHRLQPVQILESNSTGLLGVGGLGTIYVLSLISSYLPSYLSIQPWLLSTIFLVVFLVGRAIGLPEMKVQR